MSATVLIPTTGSKTVVKARKSVQAQTYSDTLPYVVVDGIEYWGAYGPNNPLKEKVNYLPINVGANGFYGHRIYAAFSQLVNTKYVLFLDQDCWFMPNHVETCINKIESENLDWCYSLRRICDVDGTYLFDDNCESLGKHKPLLDYHHVDTNCYCLKTEVARQIAHVISGGWGQDRVFYQALSQYFPKFDGTGKATVNYRLAGNAGSVTKEFFEQGNALVKQQYNEEMPWQKI